jgi:hypothetical protein
MVLRALPQHCRSFKILARPVFELCFVTLYLTIHSNSILLNIWCDRGQQILRDEAPNRSPGPDRPEEATVSHKYRCREAEGQLHIRPVHLSCPIGAWPGSSLPRSLPAATQRATRKRIGASRCSLTRTRTRMWDAQPLIISISSRRRALLSSFTYYNI